MFPQSFCSYITGHALPRVLRRIPRNIYRILLRIRYGYPRRSICQAIRDQVVAALRHSSRSIWFLPTITWFSVLFQRQQHMARALAAAGYSVLYYEPWWIPAHSVTDEGRQKRDFCGLLNIEPGLYLLRCEPAFFFDLLDELSPDNLVLYWPDQSNYVPPWSRSHVIYEVIDDHSLIKDADVAWFCVHRHWVHNADVLVATADLLYHNLHKLRDDVLLIPNGVHLNDWCSDSDREVPSDLKEARNREVVVGYYGVIAEWFSWDILEYCASARPDWSFVLIGIPYTAEDRARINNRTTRYSNIYFLGPKPYRVLSDYLYCFDIATIPFMLNPITHACSPVKLFEYMAGGKPIVTTPMKEIIKYRSVLTGETPDEFLSQLEKALCLRASDSYRSVLRQEAHENTWGARAEYLINQLEAVHRRQVGRPRRHQQNKAR